MNPSNELISLSNAFARVGCLHRDHLRQTLDRIGFKYITGPRHGRGSICFVLEDQLPALEKAFLAYLRIRLMKELSPLNAYAII